MSGKIRLGFIANKGHDPIPVGQQDRNWPEEFKKKNNTGPQAAGWGGQFHIDVAVPLKVGRLHPDVFKIDLMHPEDVSLARLRQNHLNFNLGHDYIDAFAFNGKGWAEKLKKALQPLSNNLYPEWPSQEWIYRKDVYLKALIKAGIPTIPTLFYYGKFDAKKVLKEVQAKGWKKFFVKPGDFGTYSDGVWNGSVKDCLSDMTGLLKYEKEASHFNMFLVQPYMLKPNGKVFDEIRNYFVDGEWKYAVYTDGTDESNNGFYAEPEGKRLDMVKALATRANEVRMRHSKWRGQPFKPPFVRVDIGVIPDKKCAGGLRIFVNEIEQETCTWLTRYCPFKLLDLMGEVFVQKARELLKGRLASGEKVQDGQRVQELLAVLDGRLPKQEAKGSFKRKWLEQESGGAGKVSSSRSVQKKHRTSP